MKFGIGQPMWCHEDLRLIAGRGRYTDDIVLPRMTHRSPESCRAAGRALVRAELFFQASLCPRHHRRRDLARMLWRWGGVPES
jgi:hypothetical protein